MRYKIGDLAYLFNLSAESIRHYERQGIVHPQKVYGSTYRYYSAWDLAVLSACRQYRSLGFSLEDSARMMQEQQPVAVLASLREQENAIEAEIARQCALLRTIRAWRREVESTCALVGKFELEENTPTCFLPYQYGDVLVRDDARLECVREWLRQIPYVYVGMLMPQQSDKDDLTVGLGMAEVGMEALHPPEHSSMIRIPAQLCVHTAFLLENSAPAPQQLRQTIQQWLIAHHLQAKGDMFCRFNLISHTNAGIGGVLDCFQPVE